MCNVRNGNLYYFREGVDNKNYVKLIPMSKDTFIIEELIYFRLKFELEPQGQAAAIIGMYEDGNRDRSQRDKNKKFLRMFHGPGGNLLNFLIKGD